MRHFSRSDRHTTTLQASSVQERTTRPRKPRGTRPAWHSFHADLERLEDRTMLNVDLTAFAQELHDQLGTLQTGINTTLDAAS